jgi:transposase
MLFLGIDVSKDKLDGAAVSEGTGAVLGRRSVPNTPDGVARLGRWAETIAGPSESAGIHAVIEATAAYHEPAAYSLAAAGVNVSIVNPAQVRSFARGVAVLGKTDRLDAVVLARFGRLTQPKGGGPARRLYAIYRPCSPAWTRSRPTYGARPTGSSKPVCAAAPRRCCAPSPTPWPR